MTSVAIDQIALLAIEASLVSGLLLALFRKRSAWGLSPLYIALGVFQHMQVVLAMGVYVDLGGLVVSPGSVVLFTASLFAVLLVYVEEDASEARKLIYGLLLANAVLSGLSFLAALHLKSPATRNVFNLPHEFFVQDMRVMVFGTLGLFLDAILIIVLFEGVSRLISRPLFLRILLPMLAVVTFDQVLFATAVFFQRPEYVGILVSGLVGKWGSSLFYSAALLAYLRYSKRWPARADTRPGMFDVFQTLSYRQKYDVLEVRVQERTADLRKTTERLQVEVAERTQAEAKLTTALEQLQSLHAHLESVREEERARIAREIHDELGQSLTGLKMDLAWLKGRLEKEHDTGQPARLLAKVDEMTSLIDGTFLTVRRLITELRPAILDNLGLAAAIEWQAHEFENRNGVRCTVAIEEIALEHRRSTALFRILQESLTNVARHSGATEVRVRLRTDGDMVILEITDNGKGMVAGAGPATRSFGILGMRERAGMLGGTIHIDSESGHGTAVTARIPLAAPQSRDLGSAQKH